MALDVVDGGYKNTFIDAVKGMAGRIVQVVKRPDFTKGFVVLPKRWRVKQSIGALTILRGLKTDHGSLIHVSTAAMLFAAISRPRASITMGSPFSNRP